MKKYCIILVLCLLLTACNPAVNPESSLDATGEESTSQVISSGEDGSSTQDSSTANIPGDSGSSGNSGDSGSSTGGSPDSNGRCTHVDAENDGYCDSCKAIVIVVVDFYAINDLHGKISDGDNHPGVDELSTYLENARKTNSHMVLFSVGDMWQGSSESNLTQGILTTDWMNEMDFDAMALGNHEFDWGEDLIQKNEDFADFPLLAINVFSKKTNRRVDYCDASVLIDKGSFQIGVIGAIGDCYSSISADQTKNIYFKTGKDLTALVKAESEKLKSQGADYIVYLLHDGYGSSKSNSATFVDSSSLTSYYDTSLSNGYVDLVFEGHTHQKYILKDQYGVHHLQNRGDNKGGISHAEVSINIANGKSTLKDTKLVPTSTYTGLADHPIVNNLLNKYDDTIGFAKGVLGRNSVRRSSDEMEQIVADLYYQAGVEKWGSQYQIALGGGFISARSPYNLEAGDVTYAKLQSLFPFDNQLVLCSIKGRDLKSRFFETTNDRYSISYGDYGKSIKNNINLNATYYVVVDSYSSTYAPNKLTEIARYDTTTFARDLLAKYAKQGGFQ